MRNTSDQKITNLCDEFLHIDETPEADICQTCAECDCCSRKSVTCIAQLTENQKEVYSNIYKNKIIKEDVGAIHAEMFVIYDRQLRDKLAQNQTLVLYLTYQPCHFSGGHHKTNHISCTAALLHFFNKVLAPLNINLVVKISYIYRAHWVHVDHKYSNMISNAITGLQLLSTFATIKAIEGEDYDTLYRFCDENTKQKWKSGKYMSLIKKRKTMEFFIKQFLKDLECHSEFPEL